MDLHDPSRTDSPPPPPLPSSLPPLLMEAASSNDKDGDDEEEEEDKDDVHMAGMETALPTWVNQHLHRLAECPGCIAEQRLKHTCSHVHHTKHTTCTVSHHTHNADTRHDNTNTGAKDPEPEAAPEPAEAEETPKRNRNTWPRKRGRATMIHVAYIFDADGNDDNVEPIMVENGSNYFVSVDDSVCDGGRLAEEYSLSRAGSVQRILRNSTQQLPQELETVRKGTPLYGQPDWWGDDSSSKGEDPPGPEAGTRDTTHSPSSSVQQQQHHQNQPQHPRDDHPQGLQESSCLTLPSPNTSSLTHQQKSAAAGNVSSSTKSPISLPSKDNPLTTQSPSGEPSLSVIEPSGDCAETTHPGSRAVPEVLEPPLCEDSLKASSPALSSNSPSGAEAANVKADEGSRTSGRQVAMEVNTNPALSFTVEFGDEKKPKLKSGASLSEFVPLKLRHTLSSSHARHDKSAKGRESGGSCASSEERETSPAKARPAEDSSGCETDNKGKTMHRITNGQLSAVASLGTVASEKSVTRPPQQNSPRKPQDPQKTAPPSTTTMTTTTTTTTTPSTVTTRVNKLKSTNAIQTIRYSDPTTYLIDRMFAGATRPAVLPDATSAEGSSGGDSPVVSEPASYRETKNQDRGVQRSSGSSTYRCSSKPPLQKQKTLGKVLSGTNTATEFSAKTGTDSPSGVRDEGDGAVEPALPPLQPPPPAPSADNEDKVSDAGTYTIEGDDDREEEMIARQQIDEVFGVDLNLSFERPVIDGWEKRERSVFEGKESDSKCSTPRSKEHSGLTDYSKRRTLCGWDLKDEVAPWISQLTALTSASRRSSSSSKGNDREDVTEKGQDDGSKKPPQGASNRRRPGTGRRLPSIPTGSDHSSAGSERSFRLRDFNSPDSVSSTLNGSVATRSDMDNGARFLESPVSSVRSGSRGSSCLKPSSRLSCSPCGSEESDRKVLRRAGPKNMSAMSRASLDSQLLLRKTNSVMEAMEITMGFSTTSKVREEVTRSDADLTQALTLMNGGQDGVGHSKVGPVQGEAASKVSSSVKTSSNSKLPSRSSSKTLATKTVSEQKPPITGSKNSRGGAGVSAASEKLTRHRSLDLGFRADSGEKISDPVDRGVSGSESGGKGSLTMAKTNRAFTLRRARADSTESKETERGRADVASSRSSRRSTSLHGTTRTSLSEHRVTEQGGRNDRKTRGKSATRESTSVSRRRDRSMPRMEGMGQSHRTSSSSSLTSSTTIASRAKEKDTPKNQLRSSYKDLTINGFSRGSHSQPGSRSGSPKSAERMAWKRRKEYDPRKAVAEAKANKQKEGSSRGKPKAQSSQFEQRLTRSVSLTNTAELSLAPDPGGRDPVTVDSPVSVQDLSSRGENSVQRGFLPFHSPLRAPRFSRSTDEEEAGPSPKSQHADFPQETNTSFNTSLNLQCRKSAFTPPLSKLHPSSPELSTPRRLVLVDVDFEDVGVNTHSAAAESTKSPSDSRRTDSTSPQTYNSLIVSSIFQLSQKLRSATDKTFARLREEKRVTVTPSPDDDVLDEQRRGEIPAWKSANQELASVLKNMRRLEHHLQLIDQVLFPDDDTSRDQLGMSTTDKKKYLQEIERIRTELAGFQPIARPRRQPLELPEAASPEMAQLSELLF